MLLNYRNSRQESGLQEEIASRRAQYLVNRDQACQNGSEGEIVPPLHIFSRSGPTLREVLFQQKGDIGAGNF